MRVLNKGGGGGTKGGRVRSITGGGGVI